MAANEKRVGVLKTYKIYVGGKFPRTESGRTYTVAGRDGVALANVCLCSRKDVRDAVGAARKAQPGWAGASSYLRGQILYRIAEILEGRSAQFVDELVALGAGRKAAEREVVATVDRLVYFAGWSDKYQQVFSSVNPVASSHFNFSLCEATGVVGIAAPAESGLLGLVSQIAPAIVGGNTVVAIASEQKPLPAVTLGEVLQTSDVPGGVVNILTGSREEMLTPLAEHMDVNAMVLCSDDAGERKQVETLAAENVKRVITRDPGALSARSSETPYRILDTLETKTTWHPIGV